jgi:arylsulfatase A-like enzyme
LKRKHTAFFPIFICGLLLGACLPGCSRWDGTPVQDPEKKYNIILIISDALRQDVLGCYGGPARTPHLDKLARTGVMFENAYATAPWTPPSSVSIFTGNYATSYAYAPFNKTVRVHVPDGELLLPQVLRRLGYQTAIKNENPQAGIHNCLRGFKHLPKVVRFGMAISKERKKEIQRVTNANLHGNSAAFKNSFLFLNNLMDVSPGQNFFMVHWIMDPHEPYAPVRKFMQRIKVNRDDLKYPVKLYTSRKTLKGDITEAGVEFLKARYIAEVESVDERIGYVLRLLKHKNLLETTYFVFTSDHGEQFGEHDQFGHGIFYYEDLVRVPLIISGPGLPAGKRVQSTVSLIDLMPTLKDLLGVKFNDDMQGVSFKKLMLDGQNRNKPLYFADVREHGRVDALLAGGVKLISLRDGGFELFDLTDDPAELNNLALSDTGKVQSLMKFIQSIREENLRRQAINLERMGPDDKDMSEEDKAELLEKLKALGYVN